MSLISLVRRCLLPSRVCPQVSRLLSSGTVSRTEKKDVKEEESKPRKAPAARVKELKQKYSSNPPPLMEFFDEMENWGESKVRVGREWRVEELRLKSNSDLHKLWYVLLKERNMLLTMEHEARVNCEYFPNPERRDKVEQSMLNLEEVVKERNKAYMELEVGEGETYERPRVFRPDLFGRHRLVSCSQHLLPYRLNHKYRETYGPGKGKYVSHFVAMLREQKASRVKRRTMQDWSHVRQLLRRFPSMDTEYLQELYPRVPVKFFQDHLDRFPEVKFISDHTAPKLSSKRE